MYQYKPNWQKSQKIDQQEQQYKKSAVDDDEYQRTSDSQNNENDQFRKQREFIIIYRTTHQNIRSRGSAYIRDRKTNLQDSSSNNQDRNYNNDVRFNGRGRNRGRGQKNSGNSTNNRQVKDIDREDRQQYDGRRNQKFENCRYDPTNEIQYIEKNKRVEEIEKKEDQKLANQDIEYYGDDNQENQLDLQIDQYNDEVDYYNDEVDYYNDMEQDTDNRKNQKSKQSSNQFKKEREINILDLDIEEVENDEYQEPDSKQLVSMKLKHIDTEQFLEKRNIQQQKWEQNLEMKSKTKTKQKKVKYISRNEMTQILRNKDSKDISNFFNTYEKGELRQAIDNVSIQKYKFIFQDLMKCYYILVESMSIEYIHYIKEIFESKQFRTLLLQDIESQQIQNRHSIDKLIDSLRKLLPFTLDLDFIPINEIKISMQSISQNYQFYFGIQLRQLQQIEEEISEKRIKYQLELLEMDKKQKIFREELKMKGITIDYKLCPCAPVVEDFKCGKVNEPTFGTIITTQDQGYISTELYLNNNFYILREDYLREFRNSARSLMSQRLLYNDDDRNVNIYDGLTFNGLQINNQGAFFKIMLKPFEKKKINWMKSNRLMCGSLLMMTDKSFEKIVFVQVCEKIPTQTQYVTLKISFIEGFQGFEQLQLIKKIAENNKSLILENKVYFEPYFHYLKCLQSKTPENFPFSDQIIQGSIEDPKPLYLKQQEQQRHFLGYNRKNQRKNYYQINLDFSLDKFRYYTEPTNVVDIFGKWPKEIYGSLDESQVSAVQQVLTHGIALIQGPPGTGKTFCGALALKNLIENVDSEKPIIIVCYTNHALDQFLKHIMNFVDKSKICRIGGRCKDPAVQGCVFQNQEDFKQINIMGFNYKRYKNLQNYLLSRTSAHFTKIVEDAVQKVDNGEKVEKGQAEKIEQIQTKEKEQEQDQDQLDLQEQLDSDEENDRKAMVDDDSDVDKEMEIEKAEVKKQDSVIDDEEQDSEEENQFQNEENIDQNQIKAGDDKLSLDQQILEDCQSLKDGFSDEEFDFYGIYSQGSFEEFDMKDEKQKKGKDRSLSSYEHLFDELTTMRNKFKKERLKLEIELLQNKKIIGLTVTGCAKYAKGLNQIDYDIMIIEEAAEVLECHTAAILTNQLKHLILIGDHQQLRPKLESYYLETKYKTNQSLFERLVKNGYPYATLNTQRRMKTKFADFIRLIYPNQYKDHEQIDELNQITINGIPQDLIFFNHNQNENSSRQASSSKSNQFEALMIIGLVQYLIKNGYKMQQITVLSMYVKQLLYIKKQLQLINYNDVNVQSVDNYQGEENDIIILSLVRSNTNMKLGFIGIDNRICVALSRAKIGLYVFGNFDFIHKTIIQNLKNPKSKYTDLWLKIIDLANSKKALQNCITIKCQNHENETYIQEPGHWNWVPGGGCTQQCELQFDCGHYCPDKCHYIAHIKANCPSPICIQTNQCGHHCNYPCCHVPCPPCSELIEKQQLYCEHSVIMLCSQHDIPKCKTLVSRELSCKHIQEMECSMDVNFFKCKVPCERQLDCGHNCKTFCSNDWLKIKCKVPCSRQLECGHMQESFCSDDWSKVQCRAPCEKQLECGHIFQSFCSMDWSNIRCLETIQLTLPCYHVAQIQCCDKSQIRGQYCKEICNYQLNCSHNCQGACGTCIWIGHNQCSVCEQEISNDKISGEFLKDIVFRLMEIENRNHFVQNYLNKLNPKESKNTKRKVIKVSSWEYHVIKFQLDHYYIGIKLQNLKQIEFQDNLIMQIIYINRHVIVKLCLFNDEFHQIGTQNQMNRIDQLVNYFDKKYILERIV